MAGVLLLVLGFRSSGKLAAAYGIAVTGAMVIDAVLAGIVAAARWGWGPWPSPVFGVAAPDRPRLLRRQRAQDPRGRLVPARGGRRLRLRRRHLAARPGACCGTSSTATRPTLRSFIDELDPTLTGCTGTAVFMTGNPDVVPDGAAAQPQAQQGAARAGRADDRAHARRAARAGEERVEVEELGKGFLRVTVRYGFMDEPDVPGPWSSAGRTGCAVDLMLTTFFLGRETLIPTARPDMDPVEERLFALAAGGLPATAYFGIPPDRVVELGTQVEV